jgi:hypothetical protein
MACYVCLVCSEGFAPGSEPRGCFVVSEDRMEELAQEAMAARGIDDEVVAAGLGVGSLAGMHAADARSGLPETMLVGVSATMMHGSSSRATGCR